MKNSTFAIITFLILTNIVLGIYSYVATSIIGDLKEQVEEIRYVNTTN